MCKATKLSTDTMNKMIDTSSPTLTMGRRNFNINNNNSNSSILPNQRIPNDAEIHGFYWPRILSGNTARAVNGRNKKNKKCNTLKKSPSKAASRKGIRKVDRFNHRPSVVTIDFQDATTTTTTTATPTTLNGIISTTSPIPTPSTNMIPLSAPSSPLTDAIPCLVAEKDCSLPPRPSPAPSSSFSSPSIRVSALTGRPTPMGTRRRSSGLMPTMNVPSTTMITAKRNLRRRAKSDETVVSLD